MSVELRSARSRPPAAELLRPLAILVPIGATPIVAIYILSLATPWTPLVFAGGLTALAGGGHFIYGLRITLITTIVSWGAGVVAAYFWFGITISTSLCGKTMDAGWAWLPPTIGALAFLVVGSWALRSHRITWGMPLAVAAGFAFLLLLEAVVPGTQGICET